ncbi:MAG: hypothetical protein JSS07_07400 [Proteobacteria bacterium]|nr:hypothetical protein [Pseudomonadota bacterium]
MKDENIKIRHTIFDICGDPKGPYIIPCVIDHWTTESNLESILKFGAFFGNALLKQKNITFNQNALSSFDLKNLDANAICFCPGGFVDPITMKGQDRIRIRIDLRKVDNPGQYNIFFKITDFCCPEYKTGIILTDQLSVLFQKQQPYTMHFKFNGKCISIPLSKNDLVFYGGLAGINRFCLLFPFIMLEKVFKDGSLFKEDEKILTRLIYEHLRNLDNDTLRKVLICLAQNLTLFSELNFYSMLRLSTNLIYDIHYVSRQTTYNLHHLTRESYEKKIEELRTTKSFKTSLENLPQQFEIVRTTPEGIKIALYDVMILSNGKWEEFKTDARKIDNKTIFNGYFEMRPGNRSFPFAQYSDKEQVHGLPISITLTPNFSSLSALKENYIQNNDPEIRHKTDSKLQL